jgi:cytochrome c1
METMKNLRKDIGVYALAFLALMFILWFLGVVKIMHDIFVW